MRPRRAAVSAIELLLASAVMAAAFLPIYTLVQSNQKVAYLSEYHVLARRQATRALAQLTAYPYATIAAAATGAAPPTELPGVPTDGRQIAWVLPTADQEQAFFETPGAILASFKARRKQMSVEVFFHELEPGFGRLVAVARWRDPVSRTEKSYFTVRFVQDPFHFVGAR